MHLKYTTQATENKLNHLFQFAGSAHKMSKLTQTRNKNLAKRPHTKQVYQKCKS